MGIQGNHFTNQEKAIAKIQVVNFITYFQDYQIFDGQLKVIINILKKKFIIFQDLKISSFLLIRKLHCL
jgi:hypothetical protein